MHQSPERGYFLSESGHVMTDEMFARLTGFTAEEIRVTRALLERDRVYSIDDRGIAFNRKMVREESIKKAARERQSKRRKKIKPTRNVTPNVTHNVTPVVTPVVTDIVPESQSPIVLETQKPIFATDKPPRKRVPDPVWDAVAERFFPDGIAKSQQSRVGRIVSDLKSVKATPDEFRRRVDNYASHFADCACTPEAVVKHWATCAAPKSAQAKPGGGMSHDEGWQLGLQQAKELDERIARGR